MYRAIPIPIQKIKYRYRYRDTFFIPSIGIGIAIHFSSLVSVSVSRYFFCSEYRYRYRDTFFIPSIGIGIAILFSFLVSVSVSRYIFGVSFVEIRRYRYIFLRIIIFQFSSGINQIKFKNKFLTKNIYISSTRFFVLVVT